MDPVKKPWWKSKTLGANVLIAVAGVVANAAGVPLPSPDITGVVLAGMNVVLRLLSKSKLTA